MPYIGNTVQTQGFTPQIDYFNGNGSTVTFTLSRPVVSVAQMIVSIDNVIQNPSSAYTVSGSSITFTSAPLSGTNNIWVEYTSLITTYASLSQSPSVIGDITASGGYLATGSFGASFIDGTIVDYVTGNGRITAGPADGITLYNGGTSARTALAAWDASGNLTNTGSATIQGLTVGKGLGSVSSNSAVGSGALGSNTSGNTNSAYGFYSLISNTTGSSNSSYGYTAMQNNTTGANNVAYGHSALFSNTTASNSTAVGFQAGYNSTGSANTCFGYQAGIGAAGSFSGSNNTLIGQQAGYSLTTGSNNTFVGPSSQNAGSNVTTGSNNTIIGGYGGNSGGLDIRTASNYIVLSDGSGNPRIVNDNNGRTILNGTSPLNSSRLSIYETTGNSTVYLQNSNAAPYGMRITYSGASPNSNDNWFLYFEDTTNSKFTVVSSGTTQNRTGTYGTLSDVRLKQDIVDANSQWNDIKAIRFRKYRLIDDVNANSNAPYFMGVVAQELQETSPNLVEQYADKKGEMILSVKQSIIFMKAAKALQEAMERIETLEAKVTALEAK
jgi:hypothetical protein